MTSDNYLLKKMTWAIDVFEEPEMWTNALNFVKFLSEDKTFMIDPVFVLSPAQAHVSSIDVPKWDEAFKALAEKKMRELASRLDLSGFDAGHVLIESSTSIRKMANRLIEFARSERSDLILVSTHGRKGLSRFLLGSFAETLVTQSSLPVITINPTAHSSKSISHLLFPTDFDVLSRPEFESTINLAKIWKSKVTLYFKVPPLAAQSYFTDVPGYFYGYSVDEDKDRRERSEEWRNWAEQQGVNVQVVLAETPGDVAIAITQFADKNAVDLISLSAHSGPIFSALIGSISRQVIRNAPCPVWVKYYPDWVTATRTRLKDVPSQIQNP